MHPENFFQTTCNSGEAQICQKDPRDPLFLGYVMQRVRSKLCASLCCLLFFSLEVGYGEYSIVWKVNILDTDKFPSFVAQGVKVILNIIYDWLSVSMETI